MKIGHKQENIIKKDLILINDDWKEFLSQEFEKAYFANIKKNYILALKNGAIIYPPPKLTFNAFNLTPLKDLKVIIIGQDPYHQPFQAMGLSFSVPIGIKIPPSLQNIFKELKSDLNIPPCQNGDLSKWARQGVLLLNSILSVEASKPASHFYFGWQEFTNNVIKRLSDDKKGLIFLLWGNFARSKKYLINTSKHFILEAPHPSPLARNSFLGCRHFSKTNKILLSIGKDIIDWDLN